MACKISLTLTQVDSIGRQYNYISFVRDNHFAIPNLCKLFHCADLFSVFPFPFSLVMIIVIPNVFMTFDD